MSSEAMNEFLQRSKLKYSPDRRRLNLKWRTRRGSRQIESVRHNTLSSLDREPIKCAKPACNCWMLFSGLKPLIAGSNSGHVL